MENEGFTPIDQVASQVGVPASWLRREALAGRVPHLVVGRRLLARVPDVQEELARRARQVGTNIEEVPSAQ